MEPVLRQVIEETLSHWPGRRIEAEIFLQEEISFDKRRVAQLFANLLSNAMAHGRADGPVTVRAVSDGGKFELSVANAANPIPPDVLERLFEPFSRGGKG